MHPSASPPERPAIAPAAWFLRPFAGGVTLALLTALAYSNCFSDAFIGFNAVRSIRDNPDIQQLGSLWRAMSLHLLGPAALGDGGTLVRRPVLSLSFALNHLLTGPTPSSYQAWNVAIHAMAGLALLAFVRRASTVLTGVPKAGFAFAVAALWLVHPVQTESVTYIPQRAESLMGLFLLLTLYCAVRAWQMPRSSRLWKALSLVACFLGMATKEAMVVAPLLVWLFDAVFVRRSFWRPFVEDRRFYLGLFSSWLLLGFFLFLTWADVQIDFHPPRILPYLLSQPRVILHYLRLVFFPIPLHLYVNTSTFWFDASRDWGGLMLSTASLALLLTATMMALGRRHWSGYAGIWFFLTLAPTSFVATSDVIQEHRLYLALAGPLALAAAGVGYGIDKTLGSASDKVASLLKAAVLSCVLLGCITLTRARNLDYQTEFGPFAPSDLPNAYGVIAHYELELRRDPVAARRIFEQMLSLQLPETWDNIDQPQFPRGRVINALGVVDALEGRYDDARRRFEEVLTMRTSWSVAENNLAVVDLMTGEPESARRRLEAVLADDPAIYPARFSLAIALSAAGDSARAVELIPNYQMDEQRLRELSSTRAARRELLDLRVSFPGMRPFDYTLALQPAVRDAS